MNFGELIYQQPEKIQKIYCEKLKISRINCLMHGLLFYSIKPFWKYIYVYISHN